MHSSLRWRGSDAVERSVRAHGPEPEFAGAWKSGTHSPSGRQFVRSHSRDTALRGRQNGQMGKR